MKLNLRTIITYLLIAAVPVVFIALLLYGNIRQSLIESRLSELETIADLKTQIINDYFDGIKASLITTEGYLNVKTNLPIISRYASDPENPTYLQAKKTLDAQLRYWLTLDNGIVDVVLTNTSGTVVYTTDPEDSQREIGKPLPDPGNVAFLEGKNGPYVGDIFFNKPDNIISFLATAPIYDLQNNFIGVIDLEGNTNKLYQLIDDTSGLGNTGETLIGRLEHASGTPDRVLFLNPLRSDPQAALTREVPIGSTVAVPIQSAVLEENGSGIAVDYRGDQTLAAWRYLPERNWGLVTKIDMAELLGPINSLGILMALLGLIIAAIAGFVMYLLFKKTYDNFKFAVDHSSEQIMITDPEGIILYANQATEKLSGYTIDEVVGKKAGKLWSLPMSAEFYQNFWKVIKTDKKEFIGELQNRRKNGEIYDAEIKVSPVLDEKINILFFVGIERDISTEKNLARDKENVIAKDDAILASIGDGLAVADPDGRLLYVNKAFERLTGWSSAEAVGQIFFDLVPRENSQGNKIPRAWFTDVIKKILSGKSVTTNPVSGDESIISIPSPYFIRKDGSKFPVGVEVNPIYIEGKATGIIEAFNDLTMEREVDKAKDEFLSLASHQLRTPPSIISWYTETLQSGELGPVNEKQAEYLKEVYKANQRMIATINSLLNISRIEMGTFSVSTKPIKIKDIIDETVDELTSRFNRKVTLKKYYDPALDLFKADPNILQIIIDNLLSNAFKYSPPDNTKMEIAAKIENDSLLFSVKDNGIGIPAKDQDRVFEKLFRADNAVSADPDGTGLGLYMTKKIIVDGLGGKIWFESEEGKGTTFSVSLPTSGIKDKPGTTILARVR